MNKVKHINPPMLENARKLTNLELNQLKANDEKHTIITPELLASKSLAQNRP